MEALPHMDGFDVQLLGYCDTVVFELCKLLGWELNVSQEQGNTPSYQQGSLPHRYIFEGGSEVPFANSYDTESDDGEEDSETGSDITNDEDNDEPSDACSASRQDGDVSESQEINSHSQKEEDVAS